MPKLLNKRRNKCSVLSQRNLANIMLGFIIFYAPPQCLNTSIIMMTIAFRRDVPEMILLVIEANAFVKHGI